MEAKNEEAPEFDWITLHNEVSGSLSADETSKEKLLRKVKENPLVPIGCLATAGALSYGLWSFRKGNRQMSQYMMRLRVVAQGFTLVALVVGIGIAANK
ncbi:HIG1 domain family member 2A, mitochondrial [Ischnura elegans]|uniref:HIG1 domain family member 2A, mitochondrial n=1 Tax=Ischnura elegans TaxID=197161 RepID=UPI001ED88CDD|nr:HIG1 domain family member 2A, mitochondrial [Ischnura elegans]